MNKRRQLLKWTVPAVSAVTLPTHAQTSGTEMTVTPLPDPDVCDVDPRQANIDESPQGRIFDNTITQTPVYEDAFVYSIFDELGSDFSRLWDGGVVVIPSTDGTLSSARREIGNAEATIEVSAEDLPCYVPEQEVTVQVSFDLRNLGPGEVQDPGPTGGNDTVSFGIIPGGFFSASMPFAPGTTQRIRAFGSTTVEELINSGVIMNLVLETFDENPVASPKSWEVSRFRYFLIYEP